VDISPRIGATIDVKCGVQNPAAAAEAVAKRNTPRGRSRKRRAPAPNAGRPTPADPATTLEPPSGGVAAQAEKRRPRDQARARAGRAGGVTDALALGERPQAPWHPFPLSELLILVGIIGAVVAWGRGVSHGGTGLLIASIVCVAIGTIEVTLREHLSGYRSHAVLLSVLPPLVLHSGVVLATQSQTTVPRWLNVALLPIDGALFFALYRLLRARFQDARRERTFAARR
jgi:hypothetical protein